MGRIGVEVRQDSATAARTFWVDLAGPELSGQATSRGVASQRVRFLRVRARNVGTLPAWHPASPEHAWLFVDEILVE